jgi:hypothetical protein
MAEGCDDVELLTLCDAAAADVVAAMRRGLPSSSRLQARGAFTLAKMAENDDAAARVSAVGGIEAVVDALRVYNPQRGSGRWWDVEESAWYALLMLTRSDDARAQRAIDAGALALPPAANAEGIEERNTLFERLRALQQRHADAADAAMQPEQRTCAGELRRKRRALQALRRVSRHGVLLQRAPGGRLAKPQGGVQGGAQGKGGGRSRRGGGHQQRLRRLRHRPAGDIHP